MHRILGSLGGWRRTSLLAAALAVLVGVGGVFAVSAFAVHNTGAFQLDGNATSSTTNSGPPDDWDRVCHQVTGTDCSTGFNTNGATAVDWVPEPNVNASIFTGGGSKDPNDVSSWQWKDGAGGLPDKDNLLHSFASRYSTSQGDVLFFGSDRLDNSGDAQQGFWFFQNQITQVGIASGTFNGVHKDGDVLVVSDFSNGGGTSIITVYAWDATCTKAANNNPQPGQCGDANLRVKATSASANCANPNPDAACGIVNAGTITMPWSFTDKSGTPNNQALNGEFFEGGVNLTDLGLGGKCFASVAAETRSSTSTTAVLKDFILGGFGKCTTTLSTNANASSPLSIGTGTVPSGTDTATLTITGTSTWAGTLTWYLCGPLDPTAGCDAHGVQVTSRPVSNSSPASDFVSGQASLTSVGRYCWHAHFEPDAATKAAGVGAADDDGTNECFTVSPVTPTLTTSATCSASPCILGSTLNDTASLSGTATQPGTDGTGGDTGLYKSINATNGAPADHSISWTLYGPAADGSAQCTTTKTLSTSTKSVSGDGTYGPVSYTTSAATDGLGVYTFVASYPGDGANSNTLAAADVPCAGGPSNERVTVTSQASTTTAQKWLPQDTATVTASGGATVAGSVTFSLYESADCTGSVVQTFGPVTVDSNGKATTNNTTYYTTTKTISWRATFTSSNGVASGSPSHCETMSVSTLNNDIGT